MGGLGRRTAAQVLVEQLKIHGVKRIFCVPGESFLDVLDALLDEPQIHVVTCRHESGAAMMAEAYGKLTGEPGVAFVTRGPGATNASAGIHVAFHDSTPMILFIGDIDRSARGRSAFQEVDFTAMFAPFSKWAVSIDDPARTAELVSRAFFTATNGRAGPIVLALPEDMQSEMIAPQTAGAYRRTVSDVSPRIMETVANTIGEARKPLIVMGGGSWSGEAAHNLQGFAEGWKLPVAASFRCQDYMSNASRSYVGNLGLAANPDLEAAVREADLLVLIGARMRELSSGGYSLLDIPKPRQRLIQVHPDPNEIGRIYQPEIGICATSTSFLQALKGLPPVGALPWRSQTEELRISYERWTRLPVGQGTPDVARMMEILATTLKSDAIIANGAGNFAIWPNRYHRYDGFGTMLAPMSGSMGYGIPAAISAKLQFPERQVVAFTGDGDFLMTGQELATAMKERAAIMIILLNNGRYGTIRSHQERRFPNRISATDLVNPDFCAFAKSFGAHGEKVTHTNEFPSALERSLASSVPALIDIYME